MLFHETKLVFGTGLLGDNFFHYYDIFKSSPLKVLKIMTPNYLLVQPLI